ncbi:MAG: protein-L-isoaspartate(D-aspartate) O-methyltransferase [Chitinophagaceae bacterium]|nr:protein-L-isoaspartate(D-aspartate) O-methyltransferase [Chitinophagaceae bacterium]
MRQIQEDTYRHKGLRRKLIEEIRKKGITDEKVLAAIEAIPRHYFLDPAFDKIAYEDRAFPIGSGQTISQPYTVAYQTELLQVKRLDKVLEIGTGSVYQSSVLAEMGAQVYTIERQKQLYDKNLKEYPFKSKYKKIKFFYGDGYEGLPTFAPFDKILITAAAPFIPDALVDQLKPNGILVLPLGNDEVQTMTRITKLPNGELQTETFSDFIFVPMLSGKAK